MIDKGIFEILILIIRVLRHMLGCYSLRRLWLVLFLNGRQVKFHCFVHFIFFNLFDAKHIVPCISMDWDTDNLFLSKLYLWQVIVCGLLLVVMAVGNFVNTVQTLISKFRFKAKAKKLKSQA